MDFIHIHNSLMIARLCQFAGQQYKLEENVIQILEPYMPPTLAKPFAEKIKDFKESEELNREWEKEILGYALKVFVLPKAKGLTSRFDKVVLPDELKAWQTAFQTFFNTKKKGTKLEWIYEDNTMLMELQSNDSRYDLQLRAPLLFSIVIIYLIKNGSSTYENISKGIQMSISEIEICVKKAAEGRFPFLSIIPNQNKKETIVQFNQKFRTSKKKFSIILPQHFSLQLVQKNVHDEIMKKKRLAVYNMLITKNIKSLCVAPVKSVDISVLMNTVANNLSAMFPFNNDEFNNALNSLVEQGIITVNNNEYSLNNK